MMDALNPKSEAQSPKKIQMNKKTQFNFKSAFKELEAINEWFSGEDVDIDLALTKFKRGMEVAKEIESRLKEVENEFKKVKKAS